MAASGAEAIGSMGADTPLACLNDRPTLLYNYFKQLFAQVTNPPLDAIREELVTSLFTYLGREGNLLDESPTAARLVKLKQPILTNVDLEQSRDYRKQYRRNENPRVSQLTRLTDGGAEPFEANAEPVQLRAGQRLILRAGWDECSTTSRCGDGLCTANEDSTTCAEDCGGTLRGCTGAEPYVWYDNQRRRIEPRREGITVAWYASRGHFENEQTGLDESETPDRSFTENTYIADAEPGPATLWFVIRDTRGGQSWEIRHLEVTP